MEYQAELLNDISVRQSRLQSLIQSSGADGCLLSSSVNIFYMTGMVYSGYYYLPAEGSPLHFVKRPSDCTLANSISIRKPEQIIEGLEKYGLKAPQKVFLEVDTMPYSDTLRLITSLNIAETLNASVGLRKLRSVKTDFEISQFRISARQHTAVYKLVASVYKDGMTDLEFQIEIERLMRLHGSMGLFRSYGENMDIYMGSLLVGENAETPSPFDYALGGKGTTPILPLGASGIKIQKGQTIMVDMAGNYTPWMTDMTRVFSAGKTSDLAYRAHQVSIDIHNHIKQIAKPGVECARLYNEAMEIVEKNKLEAYFMGTKQQAKFVGHGVGLEINEPPVLTPRSKELLEPNVVFAFEPKFVIPSVGAVGNENTYLVTDSGIEQLTIFEENIIEL